MKIFYTLFKANSVLFLFLMLSSRVIAQEEFSFQLYFEDANGNKDTLTLGFDPGATDSIDANFGEINLISQTWDTIFEVRAVQQGFLNQALSVMGMSKKAIVQKREFGSAITIAINKQASGIQMTWDNVLFNDSLVKGTKFHFLECASPSNTNVLLLKDIQGVYNVNNSSFACSSADSVNVFRITFKSQVEYLSIENNDTELFDALIYPNPITQDFITLELPNEVDFSKTIFLKILDLTGREVEAQRIKNNKEVISTQNWKRGIYTGVIIQNNQIVNTKKIIKL